MNDIRDRLLWRADSAGDGFHSDMIYRDALRYIDLLQIEIERLRAALRAIAAYDTDADGNWGFFRDEADAALREKTDDPD